MYASFRILLALLTVAALGAIMSAPVNAEDITKARSSDRGGRWEFMLPLDYSSSTNINGQNGSSAKVNDDFGLGFGVGYNFNDQFQLNGLFNLNSRSYVANVVNDNGSTKKYSNYMDTASLGVNAVYHIMEGDFTPFVSAGAGFTYVDTNIQNGQASGTCWYDPWWGYICDTYVPTKSETDFTYNVGVGVRYDINRKFGLTGGYFKNWIDIGHTSHTPDFDVWRLAFIFKM